MPSILTIGQGKEVPLAQRKKTSGVFLTSSALKSLLTRASPLSERIKNWDIILLNYNKQTQPLFLLLLIICKPISTVSSGSSLHLSSQNAFPSPSQSHSHQYSHFSFQQNLNTITFHATKVLGPEDSQNDVYEFVFPLLNKFLQGYNASVLAYGQTGSGKTFTMLGDEGDRQGGLTGRAMDRIMQKKEGRRLFMSFIQIYKQKFYDLLNYLPSKPLKMHQSPVDGVYIENLSEFQPQTFLQAFQLVARGQLERRVRKTQMNQRSSRSHSIIQIVLQDHQGPVLRRSKLSLCDLAGSQKIQKNQTIKEQHLSELKNINLSLSTLSNVIHCLSSHNKILPPYRDSKLTRFLHDSLGGNSFTSIIATVSTLRSCLEQSICTLRFAERAQQVRVFVKKNEIAAASPETVQKLHDQIKRLKNLLKEGPITHHVQVNQQLRQLLRENQRLKSRLLAQQQVEQLIRENLEMKQKLQHFQKDIHSDRSLQSSRYKRSSNQFLNSSFLPPLLPKVADQTSKFSIAKVTKSKALSKITMTNQSRSSAYSKNTQQPRRQESSTKILQRLQQLQKQNAASRQKYQQQMRLLQKNSRK